MVCEKINGWVQVIIEKYILVGQDMERSMKTKDMQLLRVENFPNVGKIIRRRRSSLFVTKKDDLESINLPDKAPVREPKNANGLELSTEGQKDRISILLTFSAFVLIINTAILLRALINDGIFQHRIIIEKEITSIKQQSFDAISAQHMLIMSYGGYVEDFSVEAETRKDFPQLSTTSLKVDLYTFHNVAVKYKYFGAFYKESIYFLTCNQDLPVIRFDLRNGNHHTIDKSHIIFPHLVHVTGVQVGDKFWILGGKLLTESNSHGIWDKGKMDIG